MCLEDSRGGGGQQDDNHQVPGHQSQGGPPGGAVLGPPALLLLHEEEGEQLREAVHVLGVPPSIPQRQYPGTGRVSQEATDCDLQQRSHHQSLELQDIWHGAGQGRIIRVL